MKWFGGNIVEAVQQSKINNAIFVVYVDGLNEESSKFTNLIEDERVKNILESDAFVAIKIDVKSESYIKFSEIYQLVPVPSLFLIGKNGIPLEVITSVTTTVEELEKKISTVIQKSEIDNESVSNSMLPQNVKTTEEKIINEGDVCNPMSIAKKDDKKTSINEGDDKLQQGSMSPQELQKLIEENRKLREAEEARLERQREIDRRKQGQNMQNLKNWKQEQEIKELKDKMKQTRIEEKEARDRILRRIAADKAERAEKFNQNKPVAGTSSYEPSEPSKEHSNQFPNNKTYDHSRIQFKKPNGESVVYTFEQNDKFSAVRSYVKDKLLTPNQGKDFILVTTYPRREFKVDDDEKTLKTLELCPSAVILIITACVDQNPGVSSAILPFNRVLNVFSQLIYAFFNVISGGFNYIKLWITGANGNRNNQKRSNEENTANNDSIKRRNMERFRINLYANEDSSNASTSSKSTVRRRVDGSNIHRLKDTKDSDDENNTWNGNSTQQK